LYDQAWATLKKQPKVEKAEWSAAIPSCSRLADIPLHLVCVKYM
jgi:hypothetical protein